jgi:hypothetical protein
VPNAAVGMSGLLDSAFALKSAMRSFRLPEATRGRWLSLLLLAEEEDGAWNASSRDLSDDGC